jgi:hypothetical protein
MRRFRHALMFPASALPLLVACGGGDGGAEDVLNPPVQPNALVLSVQEWQGNPAPPTEEAALPEVSLYGDGRMIVATAQSGALQTAREYRLTPTKLRAVYRQAAHAGLTRGRDFSGNVIDGAGMVITVHAGRGPQKTTVKVPWGQRSGTSGKVVGFRRSLDPAYWPARDFSVPPRPYQVDRLAVLPVAALEGPTRPWPITEVNIQGTRPCTVLRGQRRHEAEVLARRVSPATRWTRGGQAFCVVFRPLLPNEPDCSALERTL